jgi:teichuronic acid biosynthesis glycosyltransferase TuaC
VNSPKKNRSVVLISNLYPNNSEMTKGLFIKQLADSLSNLCDLTVVSPIPFHPLDLIRQPVIVKQEIIDGITVLHPRYIVIPKILRSLIGYFFSKGIFKTIQKLQQQGKAEIISAHWTYPDGYGASLVAKKLKIPFSIHALGCDINDYTKYKIRRKLIVNALNDSNINIVKSQALKDKITSLGVDSNKTIVIHNGVDQNKFIRKTSKVARNEIESTFKSVSFRDGTKYCLFIGNFQVEKGLNYLLDAFFKIKNNKVHLIIIGGGPLKNEIVAQINELGLDKYVTLLGRIEHQHIPLYMAACDLLCLPSLREGCPNVVLESLSCGTPVVASNVGAVPDIISREQFGIIVPACNAEELAKGITKGLKLKENKLSEFEWYNWHENAVKVNNVLQNLF